MRGGQLPGDLPDAAPAGCAAQKPAAWKGTGLALGNAPGFAGMPPADARSAGCGTAAGAKPDANKAKAAPVSAVAAAYAGLAVRLWLAGAASGAAVQWDAGWGLPGAAAVAGGPAGGF